MNVSSGLAFIPFRLSPVYSAAKVGLHAYTRCPRVQLKGSRVAVVEFAPPGTETKLFRDDFQAEMKGHKWMPVNKLVSQAIAGIEAGEAEIRPPEQGLLSPESSCTGAPTRADGEDGSRRKVSQLRYTGGTDPKSPRGEDMNTVVTKDRKTIGYTVSGQGPGLILVQGATGTAHNYADLAQTFHRTSRFTRRTIADAARALCHSCQKL